MRKKLNNNSDIFGNSYNPDGTRYISPIEKDSRRIGLREGYNSDVISHYKKDYERIVDEVANDICGSDWLFILSNAIDGMDVDSYEIATIINLYEEGDEDIEELLLKPYRVKDIMSHPKVKYLDNTIEDIIDDVLQDIFNSEDRDAEILNDIFDVNCIIRKYDYGGGEYESKVTFINDVLKRMMDIAQRSKGVRENKKINKDMLRKDKALLESLTKKYGKRNVLNTLNEYGNTERGQYMLGRLHRRNVEKEDMFRGVDDAAFRHNKGNWEAFDKGYEDEGIDIPTLRNKTIRFNHDVYKMKDMDKLGKKFINFIEKKDVILQYIVECMIYNQKGEKYCSPLPEIIPDFEDEILGYECTPEMKKAITKAFNEWWYYAEVQLMSDYEEE